MPQPTQRQRELISALATWAVRVSRAEPEWRAVHLELRPIRDEVRVRITVERTTAENRRETYARTTVLETTDEAYALARELHDSYVRPGTGTWLTATVTVTATGWPEPTLSVTARMNNDAEPSPWSPGEPALGAADLVQILTRHPRRHSAVPAWVHQRVAAAGMVLPEAPEAPAADPDAGGSESRPANANGGEAAPSTPDSRQAHPRSTDSPSPAATTGAVDDAARPAGPSGDDASSAGDGAAAEAGGPSPTGDGAGDADPAPSPSSPSPGPRPDALNLLVRYDSLSASAEPRRLRLGASLGLSEVIEVIGVPVPFADDRGTWVVRRGETASDGPVIAVVAQGPGASAGQVPGVEVHLLSEAGPLDLLDAEGALPLYFCSTPGTVADVIAGARQGRSVPPPIPRTPRENAALRQALEAHAADPTPKHRLDVLRQALGGTLVLDATGSQTATHAEGGKLNVANLRLPTLTGPKDMRAIGAFTSHAALLAFRKDLRRRAEEAGEEIPEAVADDKVIGVWQASAAVLAFAAKQENITHLLLDPPSPSHALGAPEFKLALAAPSNQAVKNLLLREHTQQELYDALRAPEARLFIGTQRAEGEQRVPVTITEDEEIMLAFTSPAEVAAWDTGLLIGQLSAAGALRHVLTRPIAGLRLDPCGPSLTLTRSQVWHLLGQPRA